MRQTHAILIAFFFVVYAATFLPNFGVMNSLTWLGPLPLPMAWVLGLNAVNTLLVIVIYRWYFKPYAERIEAHHTFASPAESRTEGGSL